MKKIALTAGIKDNQLFTNRTLVDVIAKNGFLPIVLAPVSLKAMPEPLTDFDGLILSDGDDITPIFYNEEPLPELKVTDPHRDQYEINLIKASHEAGLPILGIGRGLQILNVAFFKIFMGKILEPEFSTYKQPIYLYLYIMLISHLKANLHR